MGELGSTRNVGICTTVTTAWKGVVASHVQVKPVITKAAMMVTHAIKNDHPKSDSGLPIRLQEADNDNAPTTKAERDIYHVGLEGSILESNLAPSLACQHTSVSSIKATNNLADSVLGPTTQVYSDLIATAITDDAVRSFPLHGVTGTADDPPINMIALTMPTMSNRQFIPQVTPIDMETGDVITNAENECPITILTPKISQERKFAAMRMYHQATCIIFKGDIVACQFNLSDGDIGMQNQRDERSDPNILSLPQIVTDNSLLLRRQQVNSFVNSNSRLSGFVKGNDKGHFSPGTPPIPLLDSNGDIVLPPTTAPNVDPSEYVVREPNEASHLSYYSMIDGSSANFRNNGSGYSVASRKELIRAGRIVTDKVVASPRHVTLTVTKPDRRTVATVTDSSHDVDAGSNNTVSVLIDTVDMDTTACHLVVSLILASVPAHSVADMNDSYKTLCTLAITQQGRRPNHRGNRLDYSFLCWALHLMHSCFTLFVDSHNGGVYPCIQCLCTRQHSTIPPRQHCSFEPTGYRPRKADVDSQQNNNIFLQTSVERTMMRMLYQPIDRGRYLVDEITSIFLSGVQQGLDTGRTCDIIPPLFGAASSLSVTKWQSTQMTMAVFVVCSAALFLGPGTNFWVLTTSGIKMGIHG